MPGTFGVNAETLFALALFSNHPERKEAVAQSQERQREPWQRKLTDPETVIRRLFNEALASCQHDVIYGPLSQYLVRSHVDRIDFTVLDWALRGQYGIFLKQEQEEIEAETTRFWNAVVGNELLLRRLRTLRSDWGNKSHQNGCLLRTHFQLHCLALGATDGRSSFLLQTFLCMSLERITWESVAQYVMELPNSVLSNDDKPIL